jgi:hypothetical protein
VAGLGGALTYLFFCYLFRSEELMAALRVFKKKIISKKTEITRPR